MGIKERPSMRIDVPCQWVSPFYPHDELMALEYVRKVRAENIKLRELALALADCRNTTCDDCVRWDYPEGGCSLDSVMRELGIEVSKTL